MIINNKSKSLIFIFSFLLILPFVQKQWFNLYSFNTNEISFYSILYYLSGIISPTLICLNSINNFTYYKFNKNNIDRKKIIKGKALLILVVIVLSFLSYLIFDYFYINIDLITNLFNEGIKSQQPDIFQLSIFILLISILLLFKKSRLLLKKLILVNFILISFYTWYLQINNIKVNNKYHIYKYYALDNINLINVFILVAIEILYLIWSFLSYKTNLSDWLVYTPSEDDMNQILKMIIFYFFIITYYFMIA